MSVSLVMLLAVNAFTGLALILINIFSFIPVNLTICPCLMLSRPYVFLLVRQYCGFCFCKLPAFYALSYTFTLIAVLCLCSQIATCNNHK